MQDKNVELSITLMSRLQRYINRGVAELAEDADYYHIIEGGDDVLIASLSAYAKVQQILDEFSRNEAGGLSSDVKLDIPEAIQEDWKYVYGRLHTDELKGENE